MRKHRCPQLEDSTLISQKTITSEILNIICDTMTCCSLCCVCVCVVLCVCVRERAALVALEIILLAF